MEIRIPNLAFVLLGVLLAFSLSQEIEAARRNSAYNRWRSPSAHQQGDHSQHQAGGYDYEQSQDFSNIQDYDNWDRNPNQDIDHDGRQHSVDDPENWEEFSHLAHKRREALERTTRYPSRNRFGSNQRNRQKPPVQIQPPVSSTTTSPNSELHVETTTTTPEIPDEYDGPETTTDVGTFRGKAIKTPSGKDIVAFLGIPFAKPPLGDLKFKRPVPKEKLQSPYNAVNLPNACIQDSIEMFPNNRGEAQYNPNTNVSEDCLYLNIWIPASVFEEKENKLATVMFWIYGGAFFSGSSSLDVYNGAVLASENEVVVVSPQYRLGPLGFLFFGTDDAPGNVGLLDQVLALKWTNENIKHFGGDSDAVTLFGESAGGASVSFLSLSPLAKTLFNRAIIQSGICTAKWACKTPNKAREVSYELANLAGCDTHASPQAIIACLKEVDVHKLNSLQWKQTGGQILYFPFGPTVDGYYINDMPINIVGTRNAKRHEIIIGTTKDEGSFFLVYKYYKYFLEKKPTNIPFDKYIDIMKDIFQTRSDFEKDLIIDYYTNWENPNDGYGNQKIISQVIGDAFFTCPIRRYADIWSNRGLKVFFYQFTQRTSTNPWAEWMGVLHGDEIEYVFGEPLKNPAMFTPGEAELSKHMGKMFSDFAKTGKPSANWERYTSEAPVYLELNATKISDETTENRYGPDSQNCAFWNEILPSIQAKLWNEAQQNDNSNRQQSFKPSKPAYRMNQNSRPTRRHNHMHEDSHQCNHHQGSQEGLGNNYHQHQPRRSKPQSCESYCENYYNSPFTPSSTVAPCPGQVTPTESNIPPTTTPEPVDSVY